MMTCPRCNGTGSVYAAGNRIARPCPSCESKGVITESMATQDDADREIEALRKKVERHELLMRRLETLASITKSTIENDALWSAQFGGTHRGTP